MRIALITRSCPLTATDGIARQRQALAPRLAARGHDVHTFTIGESPGTVRLGGSVVHTVVRPRHPSVWFSSLPVLDWPLADSQLLWEAVERQHALAPFDVVDVPFWLAQGAVTLSRSVAPVVLWMQTTTRHLIELQARPPRAHEECLIALETDALRRAALVLGDSQVILDDLARLYGLRAGDVATAVAWPGIDDIEAPVRVPRARGCEVLVVGRLEHRKGTRELLSALPALLSQGADIRVTFVGADNSDADGFMRAEGATYPEDFAARWPQLSPRVRFLGRVSDSDLLDAYRRADILLHCAHYESFGLVFLEAMRAALPTVTFEASGAAEVHGADTACRVAHGDWERLVADVASLSRDPSRRDAMGQAARRRYLELFTSDAMAGRTLAVYDQAVSAPARGHAPSEPSRRIYQVTEALQLPDGVGQIIVRQAEMLAPLGGVQPIQTIYVQPALAPCTGRVSATPFGPRDTAVLHFYGYSRLEALFASLPGRRVLHYHNITPPRYFPPASGAFEMTTRGLAQLPRLLRHADAVTGDSWFNVREAAARLPASRPSLCLYPVVEAARLRAAPHDEEWRRGAEERKRERREIVILFVGRVASNKRQDLVIAAAQVLAEGTARPVRVLLVGDTAADRSFTASLLSSAARCPGVSVDLLGPVPDAHTYAAYRVADAYVSASEHEGFGIPLAEAMAFDVPVVACAHAAVPETLGASGILLPAWDAQRVADEIDRLCRDDAHRRRVVDGQRHNLERFTAEALNERLVAFARWARGDGAPQPFIESDVLLTGAGS